MLFCKTLGPGVAKWTAWYASTRHDQRLMHVGQYLVWKCHSNIQEISHMGLQTMPSQKSSNPESIVARPGQFDELTSRDIWNLQTQRENSQTTNMKYRGVLMIPDGWNVCLKPKWNGYRPKKPLYGIRQAGVVWSWNEIIWRTRFLWKIRARAAELA